MRVVGDLTEFGEALAAAKREALRGVRRRARPAREVRRAAAPHRVSDPRRRSTARRCISASASVRSSAAIKRSIEEAPSPALDAGLARAHGRGRRRARRVGRLRQRRHRRVFARRRRRVLFSRDERALASRASGHRDGARRRFGALAIRRSPAALPLALTAETSRRAAGPIEARINAEDPANDYPARDRHDRALGTRPSGPGLRLDAGVRARQRGLDLLRFDAGQTDRVRAPTARAADRTSAGADSTLSASTACPRTCRCCWRIARDDAFRARRDDDRVPRASAPAFLALGAGGEPEGARCWRWPRPLDDPRAWRVGGVGIPLALHARHEPCARIGSRAGGVAARGARRRRRRRLRARTTPASGSSHRAAAGRRTGGRTRVTRRRRGHLRRRDVPFRLRAAALARDRRTRAQGARRTAPSPRRCPGKIVSVAVKSRRCGGRTRPADRAWRR